MNRAMPTVKVPRLAWSPAGVTRDPDVLAAEEPLEIRVHGRSVAVTMRTPGHDRELALGFLLTEGVVRSLDDVVDVQLCRETEGGAAGNVADVRVADPGRVDFARLTRHVFSSSSCGVCGKATLAALAQAFPPAGPGPVFPAELIPSLPAVLEAAQPGFGTTGGLHASGLFDASGALRCAREDVGRHNALDKVIGRALLDDQLPLRDVLLLVSGRVSFELVQKARAAGLPVIAGIGAPTSLAVEAAAAGGMALAGFVRAGRLNVYCGHERLGLASPGAEERG